MSARGRPEKPLRPSAGPLFELARELRRARQRKGFTYAQLAREANFAIATLRAAAAGERLPSWSVTHAFVRACEGDVRQIRKLWENAQEASGRPVDRQEAIAGDEPPNPELAKTPAEFLDLMGRLRVWAEIPSLAELNRLSRGWLPPSTVSGALRRGKLPRRDLVSAYVRACGLNEKQAARWEAVWEKLKTDERLPVSATIVLPVKVVPSAPVEQFSFTHAREAARAIRRSERGRKAVQAVRPRGIFGVIRSRAPLPVILYVSARDGLLVRRGANAFALLDPPRGVPHMGKPGGWVRHLDKRWELAMLAGPPALLLALALTTVPAGMVWGWSPWLLGAGLLLCLLAMLYVLVLMVAMIGTIAVRWSMGLPAPGREKRWAAGEMRSLHWTMPLCHCTDSAEAHALLGLVGEQLRNLVRSQINRAVGGLNARTETIEVNEPLLCLLDGATTTAMRETIIKTTADVSVAGVTLLATGTGSNLRTQKITGHGSTLGLYAVAVAIVLAAEAYLLASFERAECEPACDGRPASYGTAFRWLAWRLTGDNPPDLVPATSQAWVIGWLNTLLGVIAVLLLLVTVSQSREARTERQRRFQQEMEPVLGTSTVLVMVATPEERQAVIEAVTAVTKAEPVRRNLHMHTAFELGVVSRARVLLAQARPESVAPGGAGFAAQSLIDQLNPDYLLLTGICFGLREKEQRLGDILVCTQLRIMDHKKIAEHTPGMPVEIMRGDRVAPSVTLLDRCQSARLTQDGPKVHFGPMLSSSALLHSSTMRQHMIEAEPDAIGGEVEGLGVYAAGARGKADWVVVKAIADWGMDKNNDWHKPAARNAAEFVLDVLRQGGLDRPPGRTSGSQ